MRFSLRTKAIIMIVVFALLMSSMGLFVSSRIINDTIDNNYKDNARQLATAISHMVDPVAAKAVRDKIKLIYSTTDEKVGSEEWGSPEFDEYIERFDEVKKMPEFTQILDTLTPVQNETDVDCMYLVYIDVPTKNAIYLVDAAVEDACPPGCFDPVYDVNKESLTNPARGYPPYITDTEEYGWLLTAGVPVYGENDEVICYACLDISMNDVRGEQKSYFYLTLISFLALTVVICIIGFLLVNRFIVKPIKRLSSAAEEYCNAENKAENTRFSDVVVSSRDEIRELSDSMKQMEKDLNRYITNLVKTREQLMQSREEAQEMTQMATKDPQTGLRNKRAYERDTIRLSDSITKNLAQFGIVIIDLNDLKRINDTYGHDKGDVSINTIASIICNHFKHSPVYRVGGDEFAVILENTDYRNINLISRKFAESIEHRQESQVYEPWEKVSAALGFALYDKNNDATVEDVFKRADAKMYENKKKMKEEFRQKNGQ
ncbi:MAG: diguanylate cyclase [Eubacterium sp.]|nr:diguanylate cyclase [Eubacterium sp.]